MAEYSTTNWEDIIVGEGTACEINEIMILLEDSVTQTVVLDKKNRLFIQLNIPKYSHFQKDLATVETLHGMILAWKETHSKSATQKELVQKFRNVGLNDFADKLEALFKTHAALPTPVINTISYSVIDGADSENHPLLQSSGTNSTSVSSLTFRETVELSDTEASRNNVPESTAVVIPTPSESDQVNTSHLASLPVNADAENNVSITSRNTLRYNTPISPNLDFEAYVSQLKRVFVKRIACITKWFLVILIIIVGIGIIIHLGNRQTVEKSTALSFTSEKINAKYLDSQSIEVHSFDDYTQKFQDISYARNLTLRIVVENVNDWPVNGLISDPQEIVQFIVEGPVNVHVIEEFLNNADILEEFFFNPETFACTRFEPNANFTLKPKKTLNRLKRMTLKEMGTCFSALLSLTQHIYLPNLLELHISDANITNETSILFEAFLRKLINLVSLEITLKIFTTENFVIPLNTNVLKKLTFSLTSSSNQSFVYPTLGDKGQLCGYGSRLEELHSANWLLPIDELVLCANLKVINISYEISNNKPFDNILVFLKSFQFLQKLNLTLIYVDDCPEKGLIGLEDIDCFVEKYDIRTFPCYLSVNVKSRQISQTKKPSNCSF